MLMKLRCLCSQHTINRNRVWHDGVDYRSRCTHCGEAVLRTNKGWKSFSTIQHADDRRLRRRPAA